MKTLARGLLAAAAMTVAAPAMAADVISIVGNSGTFGNSDVKCEGGNIAPCSFNSVFNFTTPVGTRLVSATVSSIASNAATNIDFSSVTLNGVAFAVASTGMVDFRTLSNLGIFSGGTNTILVSGVSGGDAAFSGDLSFAAGAVPELSTWAMLIIGFGAVGGTMRLRSARKTALAV